MTHDSADHDNAGRSPDDGILLEESTEDHEEAAGLELDPRQSAEIRQIFLTTLPDYLGPMREMIAKLSARPDDADGLKLALAKTIASIVEAASRVKLDDVAQAMEALREDVMLFGDGDEPQEPLRERIVKALDALGQLSGPSGEGAPRQSSGVRAETIVSALQGIEFVDASALQKLMAAGVGHVDQLLHADPKDVAAVSGLDIGTVTRLVRALKERRTASPREKEREPERAEEEKKAPAAEARGEEKEAIRSLVDDELELDELRGETLRLRLGIRAVRAEITALEGQCRSLRATLADAKQDTAERVRAVAERDGRCAALDQDCRAAEAELARLRARLEALQGERRAALDELGHVAGDAATLSDRLTLLLDDDRRR